MSDKEVTPTIKERPTKDAVKGTIIKRGGLHYWIKEEEVEQDHAAILARGALTVMLNDY